MEEAHEKVGIKKAEGKSAISPVWVLVEVLHRFLNDRGNGRRLIRLRCLRCR